MQATTTDEVQSVRHAIGEGFRRSAEGKWVSTKIDNVLASLHELPTTGYSMGGFVGGFLFYARVEVTFDPPGPGSYRFVGDSGGFFSFGVTALNGQLYTNDVNALVGSTTNFNFEVFPPGASVLFFDSGGNLLGYVSAVATGSMVGAGTGGGGWEFV